jgi:hypothetical protein
LIRTLQTAAPANPPQTRQASHPSQKQRSILSNPLLWKGKFLAAYSPIPQPHKVNPSRKYNHPGDRLAPKPNHLSEPLAQKIEPLQ